LWFCILQPSSSTCRGCVGGEGVYLVVDEKSRFREDNFSKAMAALGSSALADAGA